MNDVARTFKPHYLRHEEVEMWRHFHTAALMGGSAPLEAARYADQSVTAFYKRFESALVRLKPDDPESVRVWVKNEREA